MFKYKIGHTVTDETKNLVQEMFSFKIILFIELIGFSLVLSFITIALIQPKPNFFFIYAPFQLFVSLLYFIMQKITTKTV